MERDLSFDYIKGILIYLVVLGHTISWYCDNYSQSIVYNIIYSFHMPLFVTISGYFSLKSIKDKFYETLKKKTVRLVYPIIYWSIIFLLFSLLIENKPISLYLYYTELRKVWYLICIFFLTLIFNLIWKYKYKKIMAVTILILSFTVLYNYMPIDVLIHFQIIRQMPFFLGGILLASNPLWHSRIFSKSILIISACIFLIWILLFIKKTSNYSLVALNYLIKELIYTSATILMFYLLRKTYYIIKNKQWLKWFLLLGRHSLGIYVLNSIILEIIKLSMPKNFIITSSLVIFISIIVTYLCYRITLLINLNKTLRKYLLGEK